MSHSLKIYRWVNPDNKKMIWNSVKRTKGSLMLERNGVMYTFLEGKYMWPKSMENQASYPSSIKAKGRLIKDKLNGYNTYECSWKCYLLKKKLTNLYQFKYETKTKLTEIIIKLWLYKYDCITIYKYINVFNYKYNFW